MLAHARRPRARWRLGDQSVTARPNQLRAAGHGTDSHALLISCRRTVLPDDFHVIAHWLAVLVSTT